MRPSPRIRTFMGTTLRQCRLLMSVSFVKMSVIGFLVYWAENAIMDEYDKRNKWSKNAMNRLNDVLSENEFERYI